MLLLLLLLLLYFIRPPLRVRVDTFDPRRQLIDIIMEITTLNGTQEDVLLKELTKLLNPWFVKLESIKTDKDKYVVRSVVIACVFLSFLAKLILHAKTYIALSNS